ncbi:MAG TPA: sigma-E factor negative regulatory protein, partial [Lysobacter sp.]
MSPDRPMPYPDELENLSALHDGELHGDAARFALKRLGHDAEWQQACGRWQLMGDVLRGRATSAASDDLSARIASAVAVEPPLVVLP